MLNSYYYIKVFYLGDNYHGLARQPGLKTVEGELIKAFQKRKYLPDEIDLKKIPFHISGRTDKGVHSRGMVFGFINHRKGFHPIEINNILPKDIIIWSHAIIHDSTSLHSIMNYNNNKNMNENRSIFKLKEFKHPRFNAIYRHYKYYYYDDSNNLKINRLNEISSELIGKHEFINFCKHEIGRITIRTINSINIEKNGNLFIFNFKAQSFLWKQIRKIMFVLLKIAKDEWPLEYIHKLFNPDEKQIAAKIEPMPGGNLILWDIIFPTDIKFIIDLKSIDFINTEFNKRLNKFVIDSAMLSEIKYSFLEEKEIKK